MNILKVLTPKRLTGNFGERAAVRFLKKSGYKILERGFVGAGHEIDIIAERDETVVFVEVKTRSTENPDSREPRPASSVTPEKQRGILRASSVFMNKERLRKRMRYDVIEVYLEKKNNKPRVKEIKHLIGTFDRGTAYVRKYSMDH